MQKHFVTFYSLGTFVSESTTEPIETWDVAEAMTRARTVKERHGATPYGFQFSTRSREEDELDSRVINKSKIYYLGGTILTLADVKARNDPRHRVLISNMELNKWERVIENSNSWTAVFPLHDGDVILDFQP